LLEQATMTAVDAIEGADRDDAVTRGKKGGEGRRVAEGG